jgi:hypothetical protein
MRRKTDDQTILRMLKEGKTQKGIAEYFRVSPVAICKRVKRLCPSPEMPHFDRLTDKEKRFVIEKARGRTATQAVMNSYEVTSRESAKAFGSELMAKDNIRQSIEELMNYHGLTKSYRIRRLKDVIDSPDLNITHKGLDTSFKLSGDYAPEKTAHLGININISPEEMKAIQDRTEREIMAEILGKPACREAGTEEDGD